MRFACRDGRRPGAISGSWGGESKGLRKGLIVNLDSTVSSIRRAVEEAESVANVPVESAVIGVAGSHVRGVNCQGGASMGPRARDIERDDVRRAIDTARNISLPEIEKSYTFCHMSFAWMRRTASETQLEWLGRSCRPMCIL